MSTRRLNMVGLAVGLAGLAPGVMAQADGPAARVVPGAESVRAAPGSPPLRTRSERQPWTAKATGQDAGRASDGRQGRAQPRPGPVEVDATRPLTEQVGMPEARGDAPDGSEGGVADVGLTVIDFESLRHDDANVTNIGVGLGGDYYFEDGYALIKTDDANSFATFGTQEPRYPGSTALFNNAIGGRTYLTPVDNIPFTLVCMEVSNLNNNGPSTITFEGRRQDDTLVHKTVTLGVGFNRLESVYFKEFNNLIWVTWTQDSPFHQFDNIGVTKGTPEMNFQQGEHVDAGVHDFGPIYAEGDYVITKGDGEAFPFATFGTQHPSYPGSTALFNNTIDGTIRLTSLDSQEEFAEPFNVHSIDLSNLNGDGPATVEFLGKKSGGGTVSVTFKLPGKQNGLHTYNFVGFHDLVSLNWKQTAPFHQFDNIVLSRGQRVLEFEKLSIGDAGVHGWGKEYREAGFGLETDGNQGFFTFGTKEGRWPGSTALFDNAVGAKTTLKSIDGLDFAVRMVEIASLNGASPVTVKFTGTKYNDTLVTQSFKTSGNGQRLETFVFDYADFRRLKRLEWTQDSPFHQFDRVTLVPNKTDIVDFQKLEHQDGAVQDVGTVYGEDGFRLTQGNNDAFPFATYGTLTKNYPQSTAMFNNTVNGLIRLQTLSGRDFDLLEIDLAKLGTTGDPCAVTFVGTRTDGSKVSQTFTIYKPFNPNVNRLQTCHFQGFDSLAFVEWTQAAPFHQFDNISIVESVADDCYADFDGNGTLDLFDFLAYVNAFNAGGPDAECDGDPGLTLFDFLCYVNAFNAGC